MRTVSGVLALAVVVLSIVVALLVREQQEQSRDLARLTACVSTLERNQGATGSDPVMGCPIYN